MDTKLQNLYDTYAQLSRELLELCEIRHVTCLRYGGFLLKADTDRANDCARRDRVTINHKIEEKRNEMRELGSKLFKHSKEVRDAD